MNALFVLRVHPSVHNRQLGPPTGGFSVLYMAGSKCFEFELAN